MTAPRIPRLLALVLALGALAASALAAAAIGPASAAADGDPASDVLLSQPAFIPADAGLSAVREASFERLLRDAAHAGLPVRVALIPSAYDLGYVTQLWQQPRTYARFLGIELSLVFHGPLLVVMPDGFGYYWHGHPETWPGGAPAATAIPTGAGGLATAAESAITRLAAARGVHLATSAASGSGGAGGRSGSVALIIALAALACLAAAGLAVVRRRRRTAPAVPARLVPEVARPADPGLEVGHAARLGRDVAAGVRARPRSLLRWALPVLGVLVAADVAVLAATGVLFGGRARTATTAAAVSASGPTAPAEDAGSAWLRIHSRAPSFELADQHGRPVSPQQYRGRPVIVTFIDPLCRELCPLAAQVLNKVDRQLPPARRPAVIAVSVNVYADTRADLLEDVGRWSLTPEWHWAVGTPAQLEAVWLHYYVQVTVTTKRIAGTTVHYLTHSEIAYVLDGNGEERALFTWPYTARQVEAALKTL